MTIKSLAAKLRRAADVLDELLTGEISVVNENPKVAKKIRLAMKKTKKVRSLKERKAISRRMKAMWKAKRAK